MKFLLSDPRHPDSDSIWILDSWRSVYHALCSAHPLPFPPVLHNLLSFLSNCPFTPLRALLFFPPFYLPFPTCFHPPPQRLLSAPAAPESAVMKGDIC